MDIKNKILDGSTLIPISSIVVLSLLIYNLISFKTEILLSNSNIENKITLIQKDLDTYKRDSLDYWTKMQMENWSLLLKIKNINIEVPEVK